MQTFSKSYLGGIGDICYSLDVSAINRIVDSLAMLREREGRLFIIGIGGSASTGSHAANDFRKLCHIETWSAWDNASELSARANDEGWHSIFSGWLKASRLTGNDAVFVLSVGGGNLDVSPNIGDALHYAIDCGAAIVGIVGRDGGETAKLANACIIIPTIDSNLITPYTESMQSVLLHLLAFHPRLQVSVTKWESMK